MSWYVDGSGRVVMSGGGICDNGVTGLLTGSSNTFTGTGLGTKSRAVAPLLEDVGAAGAGVLDSQWTGAYPNGLGGIYDAQNQVGASFNPNSNGIGAVGTPHRGITNILSGCAETFTSNAWNMSPYLAYTIPTPPYAFRIHCWFCCDYGWNFGLGHAPANNFKSQGLSNKSGQVGSPNTLDWFVAVLGGTGFTSNTDTAHLANITDNDTALIFPDVAGHNNFWGGNAGENRLLNPFNFPVNGWIYRVWETVVSSTNALPSGGGGRITMWENSLLNVNYQGRTWDTTSDTTHYLRAGPHIFTTDAGATTQFTYGAGYFIDATSTNNTGDFQVAGLFACNASTYAASTIRIPQNLSGGSWNNTTIVGPSFNPGTLLPGSNVWFHALIENGSAGTSVDNLNINGNPGPVLVGN